MGKQSFKTGEFAFILLPTTDWHLPRAFARASKLALVVKNMPANAGDRRDTDSIPWVRKIPLEESTATQPRILGWRTPQTGAWWATAHMVAKSRARLNLLSTHTRAFASDWPPATTGAFAICLCGD